MVTISDAPTCSLRAKPSFLEHQNVSILVTLKRGSFFFLLSVLYMKRQRLNLDLGDQHEAWCRLASKYNQRPATLAREALLNIMLAENASFAEIKDDIKKISHAEKDTKVRQELSLRQDEIEALDRYADKLGVNRHQALVNIVREFVANEPQFTEDEIEAVYHSNHILRKNSVALNQMAKKINSLAQDEVKYSDLKSLTFQVKKQCLEVKKQIELHCRTVWDLVNVGRERGKLKS